MISKFQLEIALIAVVSIISLVSYSGVGHTFETDACANTISGKVAILATTRGVDYSDISYSNGTHIQTITTDPVFGYSTGTDKSIQSGAGSGTTCPTSYSVAGTGYHA